MTNVPTKLAKLVLSNAMDNNSITLAVVKLNNTNVSINFQNAGTVATSPTRPYTLPNMISIPDRNTAYSSASLETDRLFLAVPTLDDFEEMLADRKSVV